MVLIVPRRKNADPLAAFFGILMPFLQCFGPFDWKPMESSKFSLIQRSSDNCKIKLPASAGCPAVGSGSVDPLSVWPSSVFIRIPASLSKVRLAGTIRLVA